MKNLQDTVDSGRDHIELAFNGRDRENNHHNTRDSDLVDNVERHHLTNSGYAARPKSNYVQRITVLLIFGLFGGLVIILSVASATLNSVKNLKFPSTVTTAYPSLGLPGYEGYSWNDVLLQASGQEVNIMIAATLTSTHYYWITNYLAPQLAADYNIKLNFKNVAPCPYTGANAQCTTAEIVSLIKQNVAQNSDKSSGAYDIVWINGANFYNMKTNNLLYGPFADRIPSADNFDYESDTLKFDFKTPTSGYEVPYGFAYNTFIYSISTTATAASLASASVNSVLKIASYISNSPGTGKFTYAAPAKMGSSSVIEDNFDGAAFLKQAFYEVAAAGTDASFCSTYFSSTINACKAALVYKYSDFTEMDFTTIPTKYTAIAPYLFKFLRSIESKLYKDNTPANNYGGRGNDKYYPTGTTPAAFSITSIFKADSIWIMNSYTATTPATLKDANGNYMGQGYALSTGILANSNFFAIPINAKNKLAALVAINYVSSAAAMFQRKSGVLTNPSALTGWTQYQAYDSTADAFTSKDGNWNVAFDSIPNSPKCATRSELYNAKIPEPPAAYTTQLENDWYWCVLKYGDSNTPSSVSPRCG